MKKLEITVSKFEKMIKDGLEIKYSKYNGIDNNILNFLLNDNLLIKVIDIKRFYELYKINKWPKEREEKLIYYLMDIKLQTYFILEIDTVLYNDLIYGKYINVDVQNNPYLLLIHQSLDQSLILKSRILWERFMNFIYYLETGEDIEKKVSNKKSKRRVFWNFVEKYEKWDFLKQYKDFIDKYTEKLREPEVHKCSIIRKYFLNNKIIEPDILLGLNGIMMNIWQNVYDVVQFKKANYSYWNIGMDKIKKL